MQIKAALVKELRDRVGASMMDCKRALQQTNGDIELAIEEMRKSGTARAAKRAGRIAAEGCIVIKQAGNRLVILEVNSETDFVARHENFKAYADQVAEAVLAERPEDIHTLMEVESAGQTLEEARQQLVTQLGENINVRRFDLLQLTGVIGRYLHGNCRIGVVVEVAGGDEVLAKDLAMHIAASKPVCVDESGLSQTTLDKEKAIFLAQAKEEGKPDNIIERIVAGKLKKFIEEVTLLGQPFVKEPDINVATLLKGAGAAVCRFIRYEVGEGIERRSSNFAAEVMAQTRD